MTDQTIMRGRMTGAPARLRAAFVICAALVVALCAPAPAAADSAGRSAPQVANFTREAPPRVRPARPGAPALARNAEKKAERPAGALADPAPDLSGEERPAAAMKAASLRRRIPAPDAKPAALDVHVDISEQRLTLAVDGSYRAQWKVSTGKKVHWTPTGVFSPTFLSRNHRSSRYDDAPMPFAVFFNGNIAIHGTTQIKRLGRRASHGCVRLHPKNARTLFDLVRQVGRRNVTITVAD